MFGTKTLFKKNLLLYSTILSNNLVEVQMLSFYLG
uniref:Uncharacterized protein n=1 Tax=Anguilla anguilla TaxID=7936 RepID=A0A0E9VFP9_ANGAN